MSVRSKRVKNYKKSKPKIQVKARLKTGRSKNSPIKRKIIQSRPIHKRILLNPFVILMLLCVGVFLCFLTWQAIAGSVVVTAEVPAAPLQSGAYITYPVNGDNITRIQINVTGTCPSGSYVKLYINSLFSGVALCTSSNFTITTDLFSGENVLVAEDFNVTNDQGPTTPSVIVTSSALTSGNEYSGTSSKSSSSPSSTSSSNSSVTPIILSTDFSYQTFAVDHNFTWQINVGGGVPPYYITINWGDGHVSTITLKSDPLINLTHMYKSVGYYAIKVNAKDSTGLLRVIQLAALIKVPNSAGILSTTNSSNLSQSETTITANTLYKNLKYLLLIWPAFIIVALMVLSFWLGEREQYQSILNKKRKLAHR